MQNRLERTTCAVTNLSDVYCFCALVDCVKDPVNVWLVPVEEVTQAWTFRSDRTTGRVFLETENERFQTSKPSLSS